MGYFVQQRPKPGVALMHQWIQHDHLWLRRVAILHQVGFATCRLGSTLLQYHDCHDHCLQYCKNGKAGQYKETHAGAKL